MLVSGRVFEAKLFILRGCILLFRDVKLVVVLVLFKDFFLWKFHPNKSLGKMNSMLTIFVFVVFSSRVLITHQLALRIKVCVKKGISRYNPNLRMEIETINPT